ncbi:phage holin family protein [Pseudoxanthobacter soli]|nr:phage holin family protein [Pseudoxanthobacter soli]
MGIIGMTKQGMIGQLLGAALNRAVGPIIALGRARAEAMAQRAITIAIGIAVGGVLAAIGVVFLLLAVTIYATPHLGPAGAAAATGGGALVVGLIVILAVTSRRRAPPPPPAASAGVDAVFAAASDLGRSVREKAEKVADSDAARTAKSSTAVGLALAALVAGIIVGLRG